MEIVSGRGEGGPAQQRSDTFTGTVWADPVLPATDGAAVNNVFFSPGARTDWHYHENGQFLVVTAGRGLICTQGGEPYEIAVGDMIWVPAGERHWHGAGGASYLLHLAVSLGTTGWLDPVTDEEHAAQPAPRPDRG